MKIQTYGTPEKPCALLLHTMFTTGALFEKIIPMIQNDFFVIVPTLDGYDSSNSAEYLGAEPELEQIESFLKDRKITQLALAVGSSLGAMLAWKLWQRHTIPIHRLILEGAPFGWALEAVTASAESFWQVVLAVRTFPEKPCIFDERFGEAAPMMRQSCLHVTQNTILRSSETCFGPQLPEHIDTGNTKIVLIYGEQDPSYQNQKQMLMGRNDLSVRVKPNQGHCDFLIKHPLKFANLLLEE